MREGPIAIGQNRSLRAKLFSCFMLQALSSRPVQRQKASTIKRLEDNVIMIIDNMKDVDYGG